MMKPFALLLLIFSSVSNACELSKEYQDARLLIGRDAIYAYQACIRSVNEMYYWKEVAKCKLEGRGKDIGGGCQHVSGYSTPTISKSESEHCSVLKVSSEERAKALEEYIKQKNITKCSNKQTKAALRPVD